jgi:hypothetical protein
MPAWEANSTGLLKLAFVNADDMEEHIKKIVIPIAKDLGIEVTYTRGKAPAASAKPAPLIETARM